MRPQHVSAGHFFRQSGHHRKSTKELIFIGWFVLKTLPQHVSAGVFFSKVQLGKVCLKKKYKRIGFINWLVGEIPLQHVSTEGFI